MNNSGVKFLVIISLISTVNLLIAQNKGITEADVNIIGRGEIQWQDNSVSITDCFIALKEESPDKFEMTFSVKASDDQEQVQAWSGFGFQDRDNRSSVCFKIE